MSLVKHNNNSISSITTPGQIAQGKMILISEQTASGSASISFTSGIDSTYLIYIFKFINIHFSGETLMHFQGSTNGGSSYGVNITSTAFRARHYENDDVAELGYRTGDDLAESTSFQNLNSNIGGDDDHNTSGTLTIFNPSSTTFVKHFMSNLNTTASTPNSSNEFMAGYFNTTSALNAFQFATDNDEVFDDGKIKLYGIKDS
jgi:hypothetical protein